MPHLVGNKVKILPVYGVNDYGEDVFIPLNCVGLTEQSVTISTSAITHNTEGDNSATPIDHQDELLSDTDTILLLHEGNDTAFDYTWRWHPDMSAIVYKTSFQCAIGLNVSSFTSGSIDLSDCTLTISELGGGTKILYQNTFAITMTAKTGATGAWFILHADVVETFKVNSGNPIEIRLEIPASSETGVSVTQTGILPIFPYQTSAVLKPFTLSGITFHIHASLDHADPVFNQDIERLV